MAELKAEAAASADEVALLRRAEAHQHDTLRREFEDRYWVAVREHELELGTQIKVCAEADLTRCVGLQLALTQEQGPSSQQQYREPCSTSWVALVRARCWWGPQPNSALSVPAGWAVGGRRQHIVLMVLQDLTIQLKHANVPAEQLLKQARAAEQAAAAREARLEEQGREQAELAARHGTQALQALRAQLTTAHAEALLDVRCRTQRLCAARRHLSAQSHSAAATRCQLLYARTWHHCASCL